MKKKKNNAPGADRSRWIVMAGAAVLLWSTWSYCAGGNMGLFFVTALFATLSVIRKRNLPRRARWVIWPWVVIAVVCMAANVTRLVPVEGDHGYGFIFDRVATAFYTFGLCSLFFVSSRLQVSLISIASMPLIMLALRERSVAPLGAVHEQLIVWGFVLLVVVLDYTCRTTRPTELSGGVQISFKKGGARWLWLLLVLCAAYFVRTPVKVASFGLQRMVYGITNRSNSNRRSPMNAANGLYLSRPLPKGYRQRMKLLLLIDSERVPGYIRENVFAEYRNGSWVKPEDGGQRIPALNTVLDNESDEKTFSLTEESTQEVIDDWGVEVMAPGMISALCLPGSAVTLSNKDPSPLVNSNGVVTVGEEYVSQYRVGVGDQHSFISACQKTGGFSDPVYLDVPKNISSIVSNWVEDCACTGGDLSVLESAVNLQKYFRTNFTYSTNVRLKRSPDPLIDFMKQRKGICVHFSSAAALMFRSIEIPSRVVVGYVCMEWNPWVKRFVTREREGHSWVEVWDKQQKKWIVVDPTPLAGIPNNKDQSGMMRLAMDMVTSGWKRFVLWINNVNILQVIADAGASLFLFIVGVLVSPWGIAFGIGFLSFLWWRKRKSHPNLTDEEQLRSELTTMIHKIAHRDLPGDHTIHKAECWESWLKRVKGNLPEESYAELSETVERYQLLRYSKKLDVTAAKEWLAENKK